MHDAGIFVCKKFNFLYIKFLPKVYFWNFLYTQYCVYKKFRRRQFSCILMLKKTNFMYKK